MKKYLLLFVVALGLFLLQSCSGAEKCPAYSQTDTTNTEVPS